MKKPANKDPLTDLKLQGAHALLAATFDFLHRNQISPKVINDFTRRYHVGGKRRTDLKLYSNLVHSYDYMGVIMATWYSHSTFLDGASQPVPINAGKGIRSVANLIKFSGAKIDVQTVIDLMRQSPSIKFAEDGSIHALRRVFVPPKCEVARAAFVIERYLSTLINNVSERGKGSHLLLERNSYVSRADLYQIAPRLKHIADRGTAFMDLVDGELESRRVKSRKNKHVGEVGVLMFAWKREATPRKTTTKST